MTDDLPTLLLAVIESQEQLADEHHLGHCGYWRNGRWPHGDGGECSCYGPSEVRFLCQAHREIVGMWRTARKEYEVAAERRARYVGTSLDEVDRFEEAVGVAAERLQIVEQVLKALAHGYSIEEAAPPSKFRS